MYRFSMTTPGVWPSICRVGNSPLVMLFVTPTKICFVPSDARVCVAPTVGNGTIITVSVDSCGESTWFDALNLSSMSIYEKTGMKTRPESNQ